MAEASFPYERPAGVLVKTTLVDFPGRVACAFFLKGCNLRCPYCYNTGLVLGGDGDGAELVSFRALLTHLERRKNVLSGLVLSGGEPLLNPALPELIRDAKSIGYKIKLDTNGMLPDRLRALAADERTRPDFIAMDIKTSPARYASELCPKGAAHFGMPDYFEKTLSDAAAAVAELPAGAREFRTVLVPHLVEKADIEKMAALLPADAAWMFAQFRNDGCISEAYRAVSPYLDSELDELVDFAKGLVPGARLR